MVVGSTGRVDCILSHLSCLHFLMPHIFGDGLKCLKHCGLGRYDPVVVVSYYREHMLAKYWLIALYVLSCPVTVLMGV